MSDLFNKLVLRRKGTVLQRGLLPLAKRESTPWYPGCASHSLGNRNRDFPGQCTTVQLGVSLQRMSRGISTPGPAGGTGGVYMFQSMDPESCLCRRDSSAFSNPVLGQLGPLSGACMGT